MKKLLLGVLTLLVVLACFFAACDSGYEPKPHISHTFEQQALATGSNTVLKVTADIPSVYKNTYFIVTWNGSTRLTPPSIGTSKNGQSGSVNIVSGGDYNAAIDVTTTWSFTVNPGGTQEVIVFSVYTEDMYYRINEDPAPKPLDAHLVEIP